MSVTVREIYEQTCFVCLEDLGFSLGVFTEAQFLNALGVVLLEFSERAPLDKEIFTQQILADRSVYTVPEDLMKPELCFVGGRLIEKATETDLTLGHLEWKRRRGQPRQWHEDGLAVKQLEVFPKPDFNGADIPGDAPLIGKYGDFFPSERNLTIVGAAAPSKTVWTIDDTLDGIPDLFSHYLIYGVLEKIFNSDSEMRDVQRAHYCHTRWEEGITLTGAIADEELLEEDGDE